MRERDLFHFDLHFAEQEESIEENLGAYCILFAIRELQVSLYEPPANKAWCVLDEAKVWVQFFPTLSKLTD
jgi:hypothetical protein